jgi:sec-independent protein translocase protein TatA
MVAHLAFVGGLGTPELIVILIIALLLFGKRLPEVMRSLGRSVTEFKKGMNDITDKATQDPGPIGTKVEPSDDDSDSEGGKPADRKSEKTVG